MGHLCRRWKDQWGLARKPKGTGAADGGRDGGWRPKEAAQGALRARGTDRLGLSPGPATASVTLGGSS